MSSGNRPGKGGGSRGSRRPGESKIPSKTPAPAKGPRRPARAARRAAEKAAAPPVSEAQPPRPQPGARRKALLGPFHGECFASVTPGLEPTTLRELAEIGIGAAAVPGGCTWTGGLASVSLANLWLRTASRVLVRAAEFRARTFFELERNARKVPWERFVISGSAVAFRVTCRKSKLYHSDAVAERFIKAIEHRFGEAVRIADAGEESEDNDAPAGSVPKNLQLFVVRFDHDVCTVSADSSGELLHRRGYRQAVAKAPLRETLAAALVLESGWRGDAPLVDPLCGSGTIPIEAAMIARRIPPGLERSFAFERWPEHSKARWDELKAHAREGIRGKSGAPIVGADRDEGAIAAAVSNAERAGVSRDISWKVQPVSAVERVAEAGVVVTNPPYGMRVSDEGRVRDLYAQLGNIMRDHLTGWSLTMLAPPGDLPRQLRVPVRDVARLTNGGIPVRILQTGEESAPATQAEVQPS